MSSFDKNIFSLNATALMKSEEYINTLQGGHLLESLCMRYDLIKNTKINENIINTAFKTCMESKKKFNVPCSVTIVPDNNQNTQHFLWCARLFYNHYKNCNIEKYKDLSREIVNYVCDNHVYLDTKILINWINCEKWNSKANRVSIKSLTCAEMLIIFDKEDYLNATLEFIKNEIYNPDTHLFYSYYDFEIKKGLNKLETFLHENLEIAEGLFNCYEITKNEELFNFTKNIVEASCQEIKINKNVNNLSRLQCYYWAKKYNIDIDLTFIKLEVDKIIEIYEKSGIISPYTNYKKKNNVFGHIYLQRIYNEFPEDFQK